MVVPASVDRSRAGDGSDAFFLAIRNISLEMSHSRAVRVAGHIEPLPVFEGFRGHEAHADMHRRGYFFHAPAAVSLRRE